MNMISRRPRMLVADLLCGAGGSSTGAAQALAALGLDMELVCVNHWPVAIDTHSRNHPRARHHCQDIATVRPHLIVPEGFLDLLMASPSCTHHSVARGGKPTSDQQRSDPWHIITWLTELRVKRIIIENVWEFTGWGPVDPVTGRPVAERKGDYFKAWIEVIRKLGYDPEWRKLNAADYGEATTRQRFILMARNDRRQVYWPVASHAKASGDKPAWRPASEVIDWDIKGKSIFSRKKPLSKKTLARIESGLVKHGWPSPFLVILRNHMAGQSVDSPLPTIAAAGNHIGLAQPIVLSTGQGTPRSADDPLPTLTTGGAGNATRPGCARPMVVEPFVLSRHAGGAPRSIAEPTPTQVAKHSHALISPYYGSGSGETCRDVGQPLPTATAKARFGLVVPITHTGAGHRSRDAAIDPLPTLTTAHRGELALVEGGAQLDILFRMLEPHELAAAMGFNSADVAYEFAGTKTEKVKQIGNAVSVRKMRACVTALMADEVEAVPAGEVVA